MNYSASLLCEFWLRYRGLMAKQKFKILDSDMHVMEPPDLWEQYIDKPFKHRAPRGGDELKC